jgi:DNA-directed RNA polymerase subunit RPC12/RpoP
MIRPEHQDNKTKINIPRWIDSKKLSDDAGTPTKISVRKPQDMYRTVVTSYICDTCHTTYTYDQMIPQIKLSAINASEHIRCTKCASPVRPHKTTKIKESTTNTVMAERLKSTGPVASSRVPNSWIDKAAYGRMLHKVAQYLTGLGLVNPQLSFQRSSRIASDSTHRVGRAEFTCEFLDKSNNRNRIVVEAGLGLSGDVILPKTFKTLSGNEYPLNKVAISDFVHGKIFEPVIPDMNMSPLNYKDPDPTQFRNGLWGRRQIKLQKQGFLPAVLPIATELAAGMGAAEAAGAGAAGIGAADLAGAAGAAEMAGAAGMAGGAAGTAGATGAAGTLGAGTVAPTGTGIGPALDMASNIANAVPMQQQQQPPQPQDPLLNPPQMTSQQQIADNQRPAKYSGMYDNEIIDAIQREPDYMTAYNDAFMNLRSQGYSLTKDEFDGIYNSLQGAEAMPTTGQPVQPMTPAMAAIDVMSSNLIAMAERQHAKSLYVSAASALDIISKYDIPFKENWAADYAATYNASLDHGLGITEAHKRALNAAEEAVASMMVKVALRDKTTLVPFTDPKPEQEVYLQTQFAEKEFGKYEDGDKGILPEDERGYLTMFKGKEASNLNLRKVAVEHPIGFEHIDSPRPVQPIEQFDPQVMPDPRRQRPDILPNSLTGTTPPMYSDPALTRGDVRLGSEQKFAMPMQINPDFQKEIGRWNMGFNDPTEIHPMDSSTMQEVMALVYSGITDPTQLAQALESKGIDPSIVNDLISRGILSNTDDGLPRDEQTGMLTGEGSLNLKRKAYIDKEDGKYVVKSESGKKLGEHDSEEKAVKQLQAIEISKHKKGSMEKEAFSFANSSQVIDLADRVLKGFRSQDYVTATTYEEAIRELAESVVQQYLQSTEEDWVDAVYDRALDMGEAEGLRDQFSQENQGTEVTQDMKDLVSGKYRTDLPKMMNDMFNGLKNIRTTDTPPDETSNVAEGYIKATMQRFAEATGIENKPEEVGQNPINYSRLKDSLMDLIKGSNVPPLDIDIHKLKDGGYTYDELKKLYDNFKSDKGAIFPVPHSSSIKEQIVKLAEEQINQNFKLGFEVISAWKEPVFDPQNPQEENLEGVQIPESAEFHTTKTKDPSKWSMPRNLVTPMGKPMADVAPEHLTDAGAKEIDKAHEALVNLERTLFESGNALTDLKAQEFAPYQKRINEIMSEFNQGWVENPRAKNLAESILKMSQRRPEKQQKLAQAMAAHKVAIRRVQYLRTKLDNTRELVDSIATYSLFRVAPGVDLADPKELGTFLQNVYAENNPEEFKALMAKLQALNASQADTTMKAVNQYVAEISVFNATKKKTLGADANITAELAVQLDGRIIEVLDAIIAYLNRVAESAQNADAYLDQVITTAQSFLQQQQSRQVDQQFDQQPQNPVFQEALQMAASRK